MKNWKGGGMDKNSAYEEIAQNDFVSGYNLRLTGTGENESGYASNPESTQLITESLPPGINKGIGGGSFEDINKVLFFRYSSSGKNQICVYDRATKTEQVVFEDLTDSNGIPLIPLDPQNYVKAILINKTYAIWVANGLEVGYTNLTTLINGGYGTPVLAEDLSLLKPQGLPPITATYGSDDGQPANYLYGLLPQFNYQYVNVDFNYSAWSTWSKRIVPYQQNTPTLGADVTQNNYIIVSVYAGSIRATTLNIACRFGEDIFKIVKSVDRSYFTALPHTAVDVSTEIYEAYDPGTNIYSFAYYNNDISIPIPATETDLAYDYIWPSNAVENINGNLAAIADFNTLYDRPTTSVTIGAVGYNPNIDIPAGTYPDPLTKVGDFPGASGSGLGNHKRQMWIQLSGTPHTGDSVIIITADIRNASSTRNYTYVVPAGQDGDLAAVVQSISETVTGSYVLDGGVYTIYFTDLPYFGLQTFSVALFFAGATVANSIPTILDNTTYQVALSYRDKWGRFLPLEANSQFVVKTPSYAQVNGNAMSLSWQINTPATPTGAYDYQWLITKPPVTKVLDTTAALLTFIGVWDARTNTPPLAINSGNIGDTYQITTPCEPGDTVHYTNLGDNATYNTGDYITNVGGSSGGASSGQSYKVLPKNFGNLAGTGGILVFSLNPLNLLNSEYSDQNVNTGLVYDFAQGDRCTLHYWIDSGGIKHFFYQPCINLSVLGYDAGTALLKVENSDAFTFGGGHTLYNGQQIDAKNIFLRVYSPQQSVQVASTTLNQTVWYEIGERFTITNGVHDTLNGTLYDGGAYYKTRQFPDAILPYTNSPVQVLATDFNYSDFYPSQFSSFGRPRSYYDELEKAERKASIITSQPYILGSKINGITRFYPANIYGDGNGQTSSSKGGIQFLWQRGNVLVVGQERGIFYIPVNEAYQVLNEQLTGIAISEKLLNNGRYDPAGVGVGTLKESFCFKKDTGFMIEPFLSEPYEITLGGVFPISGKMSQHFRTIIALAYSQGKKIVQFYNKYYDEVMCCIETEGGILTFFPFSAGWAISAGFTIVPSDVTATTNGANSTVSYNGTTGKATYTPTADYVGGDTGTFTFTAPGGPYTRNLCLIWTAGSTAVNPFSFTPLTNQALSTVVTSNTIVVSGIDIAVPISITGGQYSKNGGAFTSVAGTVVAGDVIQVNVTTSGSNSTPASSVLTISATTGTFTATTIAASVGNYSVFAQYGITITAITDGSCTGTPSFAGSLPLAPNNNVYVAYVSITAGTVQIAYTGSPVIPGHTYLGLNQNGVMTSHVLIDNSGLQTLTFTGTTNDPTPISIFVYTA